MRIRLFILAILIASQVHSQYNEESERLLRVANKIKSKTTYSFHPEKTDSLLSHKIFYNDEGRIMREDRYNKEGKLFVSHRYEYDSLGNTLKYEVFDGNNEKRGGSNWEVSVNGSVVTNNNTRWYYNEKRQDTAMFRKNLRGEYLIAYHKTYTNGKLTRKINYDQSGDPLDTVFFQFDSVKNITTMYTTKNGETKLNSIFKMDTNNRIIEHIMYIGGVFYIPNSSRQEIEESGSQITITRQYVRNEEGIIIEEKIIKNGQHSETIRFYHQ